MLRPTIRQLRVFEEVAKAKSVSQAAKNLHLTQPAVSIQIKQLEEQGGLELFEYSDRKMIATYAGKVLLSAAQQIRSILEQTKYQFEEIQGLKAGHLELAVVSTANAFSTMLLANFLKIHPKITFSLNVTNRQQLINMINHGEGDLIIMGLPPKKIDTQTERIMQNPLVIIANNTHELVGQKNITLETLAQEPFVVREPGSGTRDALSRLFSTAKVEFAPKLEFTSLGAIKEAVQAGLGLALVSKHTIQLELAAQVISILSVENTPLIRHWHLVIPKGKKLSPIAQKFKSFVLQQTEAGNLTVDDT